MGSAVALRDVVGKAQDLFVVGIIPLHGHFNRHAVFGTCCMKDMRVKGCFGGVYIADKASNAASKCEVFFFVVTVIN